MKISESQAEAGLSANESLAKDTEDPEERMKQLKQHLMRARETRNDTRGDA